MSTWAGEIMRACMEEAKDWAGYRRHNNSPGVLRIALDSGNSMYFTASFSSGLGVFWLRVTIPIGEECIDLKMDLKMETPDKEPVSEQLAREVTGKLLNKAYVEYYALRAAPPRAFRQKVVI